MPTLPAPAVWLALLIPLSAACSSSKSDASASERVRDVNYELFPSTHQLQVQDSAAISELGADGSIVFTTVPDRAIGWPSARLTDDGGLLVSATAGPDGSSSGELLAMKVFARDGSLPDNSLVSSSSIAPQESDNLVEPRPFTPALTPLAVVLQEGAP